MDQPQWRVGAIVWVNGSEVVRHEGGHTPFSADITAVLRPLDNEIVVRADDPATDLTIPRGKQFWREKPEGIFYTPTTGIWQTAWLEPLPNHHVASVRLWPRLDGGILDFEITASQPGGVVELDARLGERHVGRWSGAAGRGRLLLTEVAPWSPDSPVLYDLVVRLIDDAGRERDRVTSYFGLRSVATRDGRFLLNGEPYIQRLVLDQGYFPGGWDTPGSDADLRPGIGLAKSVGFNRRAHHFEETRLGVSTDGWEHALTALCPLHDYGSAAALPRRYRSLSTALEPAGRPHSPYLRGFAHRGEPVLVTEFGGISLAGESRGSARGGGPPGPACPGRQGNVARVAGGAAGGGRFPHPRRGPPRRHQRLPLLPPAPG